MPVCVPLRRLWHSLMIALGIAASSLSLSSLHAKALQTEPRAASQEGFTVNFNNVSIQEVLRFLTQIGNVNFVYKAEELNFAVTIVSENPTSLPDLMSALMQVLYINNFSLIEEGNTIVIRKGTEPSRLTTVIDETTSLEDAPPLATYIFNIQNANPAKLATQLKPMLSPIAAVEAFAESRHLVVTDLTGNIAKLKELFKTLDAPLSPYDIDSYRVKNTFPSLLVPLLREILLPIGEGNPVILTPQDSTGNLFIVSTPFLISKALSVIEDLDATPLVGHAGQHLSDENIFVYKIHYQAPNVIETTLKDIAKNLSQIGYKSSALAEIVRNMRYIRATNALLFTGTQQALEKVKGILAVIDIEQAPTAAHFYFFTPKFRSAQEVLDALYEVERNLNSTELGNPNLTQTIESGTVVDFTDSLLFTGEPESIEQLKTLLPSLDRDAHTAHQSVFVYKIQYAHEEQISHALESIANEVTKSPYPNHALVSAIRNMKWIPTTNSIIFTGTSASLAHLKELLPTLDVAPEESHAPLKNLPYSKDFYMYTPRHHTGEQLIDWIDDVANDMKKSGLADPAFLKTLETAKWVKSTDSLLFTGTQNSLERAKELMITMDKAKETQPHVASDFYMFQPKFKTANQVQNQLEEIAENLENSGLADPNLLATIKSMKKVPSSNNLIFTGSPQSLTKLKEVLLTIDAPSASSEDIKHSDKSTFVVYKIKHVTGAHLISSLRSIIADLELTGQPDTELIKTIRHMRYIKETNSIVFTGSPETLQKAQALAEKFDVVATSTDAHHASPPEEYVIYRPKHIPGEELIRILDDFEQNLIHSGIEDRSLFDAINNLKWMNATQSILISGSKESIDKLEELFKRFDVPSSATKHEKSIETIADTSFLIYKLQYHKGEDIETALQKVAADLQKAHSTASNEELLSAIDSLQWIEVTNSLLATGTSATLARLKELIKNLDTPLKQVFIEVLVLQTELGDSLDFGLRWGAQGRYKNNLGIGTSSIPVPPGTSSGVDPYSSFDTNLQSITASRPPTGQDIPFSTGFDLGVIGDIIIHKGASYLALGALVNALKTSGDNTIVLNQKLITQDNKNSTLFVGSNVPFTGSVVTTQGAATTTATSLEYRDIGVNLSITPTIGEDDIVTLQVKEEITEQDNTNSSTNSGVSGITTSKTSTNTTVSLPDKHFLALSGMIRNTTFHEKTTLPCLGSIPLFGLLFTNKKNINNKQNIIIFIRPHIINSWNTYKEITENQEEIYRSQAEEEAFDAGLELVKTPDDG